MLGRELKESQTWSRNLNESQTLSNCSVLSSAFSPTGKAASGLFPAQLGLLLRASLAVFLHYDDAKTFVNNLIEK